MHIHPHVYAMDRCASATVGASAAVGALRLPSPSWRLSLILEPPQTQYRAKNLGMEAMVPESATGLGFRV